MTRRSSRGRGRSPCRSTGTKGRTARPVQVRRIRRRADVWPSSQRTGQVGARIGIHGPLQVYDRLLATLAGVITATAQAPGSAAAKTATAKSKPWTAPRTPDGHPDLQGTWTNGTIRRSSVDGSRLTLTKDEVDRLEKGVEDRAKRLDEPSDPNRPAPPKVATDRPARRQCRRLQQFLAGSRRPRRGRQRRVKLAHRGSA